ncbi:MAG: hypothetical protein ACP5NE_02235 [Candidatus Micrarchaeia archaeon]
MKLNVFGRKKWASITQINLKYNGEIHSTEGVEAKGRVFTVTVPFTNRRYSNALVDAGIIKAGDFEPVKIKSINALPPFKVISIEPQLPREIGLEERVEFKISIEAPDYSYSGPMTLEFVEQSKELVHLELTSVIVKAIGKEIVAESSMNMFNIPKNQIFQQNIQFLKILDYGTKVESITVDKPFEFEGSEPKLPFLINDASSFVVSLYIKAPDSNYAGPLTLHIM